MYKPESRSSISEKRGQDFSLIEKCLEFDQKIGIVMKLFLIKETFELK